MTYSVLDPFNLQPGAEQDQTPFSPADISPADTSPAGNDNPEKPLLGEPYFQNGKTGYYIDTGQGGIYVSEERMLEHTDNGAKAIDPKWFQWVDVEPVEERGYAGLEEKSIDLAYDMWDDFESFAISNQVYEKEQLDMARANLPAAGAAELAGYNYITDTAPGKTAATNAENQFTTDVMPGRTEADIATSKYTTEYTPYKTEADIAGAQEQTAMIGLRAPVMSEYFNQVMAGVDPKESMDSATAEVMKANDATKASMSRDAMAMGIDPGSDKWNSMMSEDRNQQTGAIADARTKARKTADDTNFSRLFGAMGVGA